MPAAQGTYGYDEAGLGQLQSVMVSVEDRLSVAKGSEKGVLMESAAAPESEAVRNVYFGLKTKKSINGGKNGGAPPREKVAFGGIRGLSDASEHVIKALGMNNLPVVLGSIDKEVPLIVTDSLHLDAILGTDALGMFQTAIDLEARAMLLKDSGEMLPITRRRDI
ncbi:hypothetical protein F442_10370 [Phytophthora nicotianae P10297]|uniref:Uncharacterized protein n=1 Tax=Phytophthora nicotianae P10297 TaxID=1317064 RepID=W2Z661_PHYNI|nr:hypothetical protein F442_10370 [Phytophthora nicotianae P10297]